MTEEIAARPKLSAEGLRAKKNVEAIAEMEREIFEFLEQQHPDFLSNTIIYHAIRSVHYKIRHLLSL